MSNLSLFTGLRFRHTFWKYQQMILDVVAQQAATDRKYHIVAPPGSGKTIVGLELIRRFGRPAVVFVPTTTIQRQWRERVSLFTDDRVWIADHTSLNAARLSSINVLTYQVLSTPGENLAFVERIAVERWAEDLLASGQAGTQDEAHGRIATLQEANPKAFRREISKRYRRVKREFLRQGDFDGRQFLHPNARDLIDRIAGLGAGTVVLDECHHLLDYWAFILRELIKVLPDVRVVGLTATLPDPQNAAEYENYTSLLGDVDFEVPAPAVVKEGNLAPYRDMVYFCEPSLRENQYLNRIQSHFEASVQQVTETLAFRSWVQKAIFDSRQVDAGADGLFESFESFFKREPLLCIAGAKFLLAQRHAFSTSIPLIEEIQRPLSIDDWLVLLEGFALRVLKISDDADHQALYRDLRRALLPFGITITERGARRGRSPVDLVLALSESKDRATVEILQAEAAALGDRLRAVVITDFERMSARSRRLKDVLDPDAGSAVRVFRHLIADPQTNELDPILVTGKVVLVDADNRARLEAGIRRWADENRATFTWAWRSTDDPRILRLVGQGKTWSPRTYVALVTDLFERGVTRCLVGTRGIFGEGWDALSLNTLVDLTSVTARTGVQQIRGRSLRLDPAWPRKVAHNWNVICHSKAFDKGDADVRRFVARHEHTWGIVPPAALGERARTAAIAGLGQSLPAAGRVVKGLAHVDIELATELQSTPFGQIDFARHTRRMLDGIEQRDDVYELWGVGDPYDNTAFCVTQIPPRDLAFRTARTVERSMRGVSRRLWASVLGLAGLVAVQVLLGLLAAGSPLLLIPLIILGLAAMVTVGLIGGWRTWRAIRRAFAAVPADDTLLDVGRALLEALRCPAVGLVGDHLSAENVLVRKEKETGNLEVLVDYASPEDSKVFSQAFQELLGPIGDARYLIERDCSTLGKPTYRRLWLWIRKRLGISDADLKDYHRVPDVLASHRERAAALARYWKQYVGGGKLIYTRTAAGRRILLEARSRRRQRIRQMAFEFWK